MPPKATKRGKASKATTPKETTATTTATSASDFLTKSKEAYEQELKDLAKKARTQKGYWAGQLAIYIHSIILLGLIAIASNVSQLVLSPVYGSIPASIWHSKLVMAACFTGWASNIFLDRALPIEPVELLPLIAIYIPPVQYLLFRASGYLGAYYGPLVTELLTLFPLITISSACVATNLEYADFGPVPKFIADAVPGLGSFGFFKFAEKMSGNFIAQNIGKNFYMTRIGLEGLLAASYTTIAPSKFLLFGLPALLHTTLLNPHLPSPMALSRLNSGLEKEGWLVLDRRDSITGYVSVVDSLNDGFRVLRCDHSLLGGEWVKFKDTGRFKGNQVAEPIYGVFAMLEAVRLVEVPNPVPDNEAKALVIGLGIGTTPAALVAHGINTTVVEIDPVVHEFATKYFQLPSNHTAVIEDAVSYTDRLVNETQGVGQFDYIIHDVFTGGAEPVALFTYEFLQNLNSLLKPDGVVAINYAGDFSLPPPLLITNTIRSVFGPSCRIFREHPRDEAQAAAHNGRDFTNMVIFCTKSSTQEITFRNPTSRDLLNSPSREAFLLPKWEVTEEDLLRGVNGSVEEAEKLGVLRRNDTSALEKWQEGSALGHWEIMRGVLPEVVWVNW
ncbi:S-adenosyl-L-methionine-dependent methyltransferase [Neurospora tetraspora]|uniref:S-adenosyl-L-methionine-dependent methyltransferase n=1 Tax=Neurospora tetraspora TaxID=94610 RepID=A0AAE0JBX7_9PEZI|nr:S-adenosyl-L-methionine-dependent methyltransferase [Neurospora tetraspora]